jgi:hypothetical protein
MARELTERAIGGANLCRGPVSGDKFYGNFRPKAQAAAYLGIGITLLESLRVPAVKLGRRCVYDRVDLDLWLDEYKHRGRAGKETLWPVKADSTGGGTPVSGGSMLHYPTELAYAEVQGRKVARLSRAMNWPL